MGRKPNIDNKTISQYEDSERKRYFREHYHNKVNTSDKNMVSKICKKKIVLEYLIKEVGINTILELYLEQAKKDYDTIVDKKTKP